MQSPRRLNWWGFHVFRRLFGRCLRRVCSHRLFHVGECCVNVARQTNFLHKDDVEMTSGSCKRNKGFQGVKEGDAAEGASGHGLFQ